FQLVAGQPQLVEFFAYWDPVSQGMAPIVHVLEDRYQDRIRFVYLDIEDPANSLFKTLIGNRLPPMFFLLDSQGNVVEQWQGRVPAEDFEQVFATLPP
ncbi:MAG: TlpA family protein disulfide reductase, partial [Anaerolineales bacterium]